MVWCVVCGVRVEVVCGVRVEVVCGVRVDVLRLEAVGVRDRKL